MAANISIQELLADEGDATSVAEKIEDRLSQELIIAFVGPVGSGVSTAATMMRDILATDFQYDVAPIIKLSDIIKDESHRVGMSPTLSDKLDDYIGQMQEIGNALRRRFGNYYLTEKVIEKICKYRTERFGYDGLIQKPGRRAYILDSLKNMEEMTLLKRIYGETLIVCGVFAPDELRKSRLENDGADSTKVDKVIDRDQGEVITFGQMTRKIFQKADLFVCNDRRKEDMKHKISRFLELAFDSAVHTPSRAESAMYEANSAAASSACMSRQVGAAIVSKAGELIAVGWNDVPKFGGSLYGEDDRSIHEAHGTYDGDHRCYNWGKKICHNEVRRDSILDELALKIMQSGVAKDDIDIQDIRNVLQGSGVDSLIEFSRSIHAEMEAILSVAREGRHSLLGSTLYTTTYPCHGCARHIVAAGIFSVIYIEPYKKSLATTLHSDAITEDVSHTHKVVFRQYDGVAPSNFVRLFRPASERKLAGRLGSGPVKSLAEIMIG